MTSEYYNRMSNSHLETLSGKNIGHQMSRGLGWSEGRGLDGTAEPTRDVRQRR